MRIGLLAVLPLLAIVNYCNGEALVTPSKPNITETFVTWMIVNVQYFMDDTSILGNGYWAKSGQEGKQVVNVTFQNVSNSGSNLLKKGNTVFMPGQSLFQLQRCDLNSTLFSSQIQNDTAGINECDYYKDCAIVDMWEWLPNAKYQGRKEFINQQLDIWEGQITNFTTVLIGVPPSRPSLPVIYQETDTEFGSSISVEFVDFLAMEPPHSVFDEQLCSKNIKNKPTRKERSHKLRNRAFNFLF